jgi:RNA polymerase sigma-70 factor (ECF subfamily)
MGGEPMEELSDRELMVMFKHGRREAFEVLFARHRHHVWSYLRRLLADETSAEDLTQDVFLAVIRSRESYEPEAPFSAWLFRIATNAARSHLRRGNSAAVHALSDNENDAPAKAASESPPQAAYGHELSTALEHAIRELPEPLREVFLLHQVHRVPDAEIAEALEIAPASVRVYLHRARRKLYHELRPLIDDRKGSNAHD